MDAEHHATPSSRRDGELDPEVILRDLGWQPPSSSARPRPAEAVSRQAAAALRYCSFCWFALSPGAVECPDCGHSVQDMLATRDTYAVIDAAWIPPSRSAEGARAAEDRPASVTVAPARLPATPILGPRLTVTPPLLFPEGYLDMQDADARRQLVAALSVGFVVFLAIVACGVIAFFSLGG